MSDPTFTVARATACHLCEDAEEALCEAAQDRPPRIEVIDADSPAGTDDSHSL